MADKEIRDAAHRDELPKEDKKGGGDPLEELKSPASARQMFDAIGGNKGALKLGMIEWSDLSPEDKSDVGGVKGALEDGLIKWNDLSIQEKQQNWHLRPKK